MAFSLRPSSFPTAAGCLPDTITKETAPAGDAEAVGALQYACAERQGDARPDNSPARKPLQLWMVKIPWFVQSEPSGTVPLTPPERILMRHHYPCSPRPGTPFPDGI